VAAEFDRDGNWLIFSWDGVGLGRDGTLWGGEAFTGSPGNWQRFASLRPFRLPGGDKAGREPWRSAAALHWECERPWTPAADAAGLAHSAWQRDINCPTTSAAGRVFDAAAAVICELPRVSFEAQGPMMLEALCTGREQGVDLPLLEGDVLCSDWEPLLDVIADSSLAPERRAAIFHASMAGAIVAQARAARDRHAVAQIGLSGGVFQNRFLADEAIARLAADGFEVFLPRALPCNDAALSYGQAAEVAARQEHG
jgi:hydrogenase maturation protein HypF